MFSLDDFVEQLIEIKYDDIECAHRKADMVLCDVIEQLAGALASISLDREIYNKVQQILEQYHSIEK